MSFAKLPRVLRTASFGLALFYALVSAISTVILGLVLYWTVQVSLEAQMRTRIDAEVEYLSKELENEGVDELIEEVRERASFFRALEYQLIDADGRALVEGDLPSITLMDGWTDVEVPSGTNGARPFKVRAAVLADGTRLLVADDMTPIKQIREAFLAGLVWVLLVFLLLSLVGGYLLSRAFLGRVDAITDTAEAIIAGDLKSRVPHHGTTDNLDRLAQTLNRMLDRMQALMESLTQVSNDIAHALRTPLGRLRQRLEVAQAAAPRPSPCEGAIGAALRETDKILETFSALLRIAQMEAATRSAGFREVDLSALFTTVAEAYAAAAEEQGKTLTSRISPSIRMLGDKDLLAEMLTNLLDNAVTHTSQGVEIELSLSNGGDKVLASVADRGEGVPEGERDKIFDRFYRLERSMPVPGTGLGLALVAAVAELHGVEINAEDNGPGLRMTMTFRPERIED